MRGRPGGHLQFSGWRFEDGLASICVLIHSCKMPKESETTGLNDGWKWWLVSNATVVGICDKVVPMNAEDSLQAPLVHCINPLYILRSGANLKHTCHVAVHSRRWLNMVITSWTCRTQATAASVSPTHQWTPTYVCTGCHRLYVYYHTRVPLSATDVLLSQDRVRGTVYQLL